ncbi:MAG: OsmC family protein [Candidatus Dormibacteraeota bacterium]|nr:OsmC family protein [Candidatus Dormibacteraeota bacterium]
MGEPQVTVESVPGGGFRALSPRGAALLMDAAQEEGGAPGWQPVELLMAALAGCMAMDVQRILERSRAEPAAGRIAVRATERSDELPGRPILGFELTHDWETQGGTEAVERAIRLAAERYCTVQLTVQRGPSVSHRIRAIPGPPPG